MEMNVARSKAIEYLSKEIILSEFNPDDFPLYSPPSRNNHFFFTFKLSTDPSQIGSAPAIAVSKKDGSVRYLGSIGE